MKRKLNEANVNLSIADLNSTDLQALSQILSLAGTAENTNTETSGMGPYSSITSTPSLDAATDTTIPLVGDEVGTISASDTDEFDLGMDNLVDDTTIEGDEYMDDYSDDEFDLGMDDLIDDNVEEDDEFDLRLEDLTDEDDQFTESLNRLAGLSGLMESDEEDDEEFEEDIEDEMEEDALEEGRLMPNLDLDEDAVAQMSSPGIGNNKLYGPYNSTLEASAEAKNHLGGGQPGINFRLITKPDGVYWTESVNEDAANRPNFEDVCTKAVENSRHACDKEIQKDGDNTMKMPVTESVKDLHKSLNAAFAKFMEK